MTGPAAKQISSPFSTGGGGVNFELQVQESFYLLTKFHKITNLVSGGKVILRNQSR